MKTTAELLAEIERSGGTIEAKPLDEILADLEKVVTPPLKDFKEVEASLTASLVANHVRSDAFDLEGFANSPMIQQLVADVTQLNVFMNMRDGFTGTVVVGFGSASNAEAAYNLAYIGRAGLRQHLIDSDGDTLYLAFVDSWKLEQQGNEIHLTVAVEGDLASKDIESFQGLTTWLQGLK